VTDSAGTDTNAVDISDLTAEYRQLSKSIQQVSTIRIVLLFIVAYAFSSLSSKIGSLEGNERIDTASNQLVATLHERNANVRPFDPGPFVVGICPDPSDYAYKLLGFHLAIDDKVLGEITPEVYKLCGIYRDAFTLPVDILGFKMELDLRHWIYTLPLLYLISAMYLGLQRKKVLVVRLLMKERLAADIDSTVAHRLFFAMDKGGPTPYSSIPWELLSGLYRILSVAIFTYLAWLLKPFWILLNTGDILGISHCVLIILVTSSVYYLYSTARLAQQFAPEISDFQRTTRFPGFNWLQIRSSILYKVGKTFHSGKLSRRSLVTGSGMVLLTLILYSTASCNSDERPQKGYELAFGTNENVSWVLTDFYSGDSDTLREIFDTMGKWAYRLSLALAILAMIMGALGKQHFVFGLFAVSAVLSSFLLTQLSFALTLPLLDLLGFNLSLILRQLWIVYWVAISYMWCRFAIVRKLKPGAKLPDRFLLILLYVPQLPALLSLSVALHGPFAGKIMESLEAHWPWLPGLAAYFLGVHLIMLGYLLRLLNNSSGPEQTLIDSLSVGSD
jgi:hypothetical protein